MTDPNPTIETSDPERLVENPLVSVLMITYNHEEYLADAIEGVMCQQCGFPFELIIGEDASTDGARKVALEYQQRYPDQIRVVYSKANVGAHANACRIFDRARGEFVAFCEGDDFWCASDKLERQVALIKGRDGVGIVHSDWTKARLKRSGWVFDPHKSVHSRVDLRYLQGNLFQTWHYPKILRTCTVLMRSDLAEVYYSSCLRKSKYPFGDIVRNAIVTSRYLVAYLPEVASVYRVSPNSALRSGAKSRVRFYKSCLEFDTAARAFFPGCANYQPGFRWDSAAGLLVWGVRALDWRAVATAMHDFRRHFTLWEFVVTGYKAVAMRVPTWRRQPREWPSVPDTIRAKMIE